MNNSKELDKILDELQLTVNSYSDKPSRHLDNPAKHNVAGSFLSEMEKEFDKIYVDHSISTDGKPLNELDSPSRKPHRSHTSNGVSRSNSRRQPSDREGKYSPSRGRVNGTGHPHSRQLPAKSQQMVFKRSMAKLDDDQETIHEPSSDEEEVNTQHSRFTKNKSSVKIENVTVDDYGDLDDLIRNLDRFLHGNTKRARSRLSVINPPASSSQSAKQDGERSHKSSSGKAEGPHETDTQSDSQEQNEEKAKIASQKLQEMNIKKFAVRIYIDDADHFEIVHMTSLTTAETLIADMQEKSHIDGSDQWTLFELANDYGIERPLRDWDVISDTIESWEANSSNALVLRRYTLRSTLTVDGLVEHYPTLSGWMYLEMKKHKWQKKHFVLKEGAIYFSKDIKGTNEQFLCALSNFDIYTLTKSRKKAPTEFIFSLKSSDSVHLFENAEDFVHFICVESGDALKEWVLGLRQAKNRHIYETNPELFARDDEEDDRSLGRSKSLRVKEGGLGRNKSIRKSPDVGADSKSRSNDSDSETSSANGNPCDNTFTPGSLLFFNPQPTEETKEEEEKKPEPVKFKEGTLLSLDIKPQFKPPEIAEKFNPVFREGTLLHRDGKSSKSQGRALDFDSDNNPKFKSGTLLHRSTSKSTKPSRVPEEREETGRLFRSGTLLHADGKRSARANKTLDLDPEGSAVYKSGSLLHEDAGRSRTPQKASGRQAGPLLDEVSRPRLSRKNSNKYTGMEREESLGSSFREGSLLHSDFNKSSSGESYAGAQLHRSGSGLSRSRSLKINHTTEADIRRYNSGSLLDEMPHSPTRNAPHNSSAKPLLDDTPKQHRTGLSRSRTTVSRRNPGQPLLQLDLKPEEALSKNLRSQKIKPLISFNKGGNGHPLVDVKPTSTTPQYTNAVPSHMDKPLLSFEGEPQPVVILDTELKEK